MIDKYAQDHSESELIDFLKTIIPLKICFQLPNEFVINQGFYTQLKPARADSKTGNAFDTSIMYKEYVQYFDMHIFIDVSDIEESKISTIIETLNKINYLGKKDSLITYVRHCFVEKLPEKIIRPINMGLMQGMILAMDDLYAEYSPNTEREYLKSLREKGGYGKNAERNSIDYLFPYRLKSTTKKYTCYTLI